MIGPYDVAAHPAARRGRSAGDRGVGRRGHRDHPPEQAGVRGALRLRHLGRASADGPGDRERLGLRGGGPQIVITDLGILRPDPETCELVLTELHPGCTAEQAVEATGWPLRVADELRPDRTRRRTSELAALAALKAA